MLKEAGKFQKPVLSWYIKNREGKYCHFTEDSANTIIFSRNKSLGSIFVGTRDYVDGVCHGLKIGLLEEFTPEQVIHVQIPTNEQA